MSYDFQLWTSVAVSADALPEATAWELQSDTWVRAGKGWQIVVHPNQAVEPEDVPDEVMPVLPGISRLTALHLEPGSAPQKAHALLVKTGKALGRAGGVLVDPQTDELLSAGRGRKYAPDRRGETFAIVHLGWWFTEGPLLHRAGVERLLELMRRLLPEALPHRYGLYEPPQHKLEQQGPEHFLDLLEAERGRTVVWYPKRPARDVAFRCDRVWGAHRLGFRANSFSIAVEAAALAEPGWSLAVRRFWRAASELIRPFYGDVRTLAGYSGKGAVLWAGRETEAHPIKGWWWRGIPSRLGHEVVLGPPYLELWPAFSAAAEHVGELGFSTTDSWAPGEDLTTRVGEVPETLVQPRFPPASGSWEEVERAIELERHTYPSVFPFARPTRS